MLTIRSRNAAVLPSLAASCTSDGVDTRSARAHRADARTSPINPSADLAGRATRLGLEVIANNPRQDFDQPGCQDGLRLTLTNKLNFEREICQQTSRLSRIPLEHDAHRPRDIWLSDLTDKLAGGPLLRMQQMTRSMQLIEALGGGWGLNELSTECQVQAKRP
jgi:hypothetical protein